MRRISLTLEPFIIQILDTLENAGFDAYLVGGAVRDLLVNRPVRDWDFTTNAKPDEIINLFSESFYNNEFGTVGVIDPTLKDTEKQEVYEITTFRSESGYSDNRRPDQVEWGDKLEGDLERRDFTISAMALKKLDNSQFQLLDFHNGETDLKNKIIRTVGNPNERFREDALRMMRAIRIGSQLGFTIEEYTLNAIEVNASLIEKISFERIREELLKIVVSNYGSQGIKLLYSTGLLNYIVPELIETRGVDQSGHHTDDVWTHSLKSMDASPSRDPLVKLATLLHDVGKPRSRAYVCSNCHHYFRQDPNDKIVCKRCGNEDSYRDCVVFHNHEVIGERMAEEIGQRLKLSAKDLHRLTTLVRWHMFSVDERQSDKAIRRFIRQVGTENLDDMLALRTGDRIGGGARETSWRLERFKKLLVEVQQQPFTVHDLKIKGNEIMEMLNISPGREIGKILNRLFDEVEDGVVINENETLKKRVKEIYEEVIAG